MPGGQCGPHGNADLAAGTGDAAANGRLFIAARARDTLGMRGRRRHHDDSGKDNPEARRYEGKGRKDTGDEGDHPSSIRRSGLPVRAGGLFGRKAAGQPRAVALQETPFP
jgi:hypothetical protein